MRRRAILVALTAVAVGPVLISLGAAKTAQSAGQPLGSPAPQDSVPGDPARALPSSPTADDDGDRVRNLDDLCPTTPAKVPATKGGCALSELIASPAALLDGASKSVVDARDGVQALTELRSRGRKHSRRLARGLKMMRLAGRQLPRNPCRAARTARAAVIQTRGGAAGVAKVVKASQRSIRSEATRFFRKRSAKHQDGSAFDVLYYEEQYAANLARDAHLELQSLQRLIGKTCKLSGKTRTVRARVLSIDKRGSLARLSNGTTLVLGGARKSRGLEIGVTVRARGVPLKGGSGLARAAKKGASPKVLIVDSVVGATSKNVPTVQLQCKFQTSVAPVQDFLHPASVVYFDERGFRDGNKYQLEGGMALGAKGNSTCANGATKHDSFKVYLEYKDTNGANHDELLGSPATGEPAVLPMDVNPSVPATVRFETTHSECTYQGDIAFCDHGPPSTTTAPAKILKQGSWGKAVYDQTTFSLPDPSSDDFEKAKLLGIAGSPVIGAAVLGYGYKAVPAGTSYPNPGFIGQGESFEVHDNVPVVGPEAYTDKQPGIPAGLLAAWVVGTRGGHPYQYIARQDDIVTDRVSKCPGASEDSFYMLPWHYDFVTEVQQGNNTLDPDASHAIGTGQAYAFDFGMIKNERGFATRGGLTDLVVENRTQHSNPNNAEFWVPGNVLRIWHQDDTFSWYEHMKPNGVTPDEGTIVDRGDWVITVDNTGNTTGTHLHYHVTNVRGKEKRAGYYNASRGGTIQIRFEVGFNHPPIALPCVIPKVHSKWVSTNSRAQGLPLTDP